MEDARDAAGGGAMTSLHSRAPEQRVMYRVVFIAAGGFVRWPGACSGEGAGRRRRSEGGRLGFVEGVCALSVGRGFPRVGAEVGMESWSSVSRLAGGRGMSASVEVRGCVACADERPETIFSEVPSTRLNLHCREFRKIWCNRTVHYCIYTALTCPRS